MLERFTVLSDSRWAPPEEQKWPFCIGHHSNLCFPTFCFFRLSWRVLGRPWNGRGTVFGCLGAILGRIGAGLGKRSGEVWAYVDLFAVNVLSWRVLGRSWNALGLVFGCLGAVLGRIGAVFGKRSGEVLTPWSLLGRLLEAAWGLLLICRWFCMDFDSFWEGFWICGIRFSMDLLLILNVFLEGFGNENRQPDRSKYWWTFQ